MIEPYFAVWLNTTKELSKEESLPDDWRDAWKVSNRYEKSVFLAFFFSAFCAFALCIVALFNNSLFPVCGIVYGIFFLLYAVANRAITLRDRRLPARKLERASGFVRRLRDNLEKVGIANRDQILVLKDEAQRIYDGKARQRDKIIRGSFEAFIVVALVLVVNFIIAMLEHGLSDAVAGILVLLALVVFAMLVLLIYAVWRVVDRLGPLPLRQLDSFIADLSCLLVQDAAARPAAARRYSRVRKTPSSHPKRNRIRF